MSRGEEQARVMCVKQTDATARRVRLSWIVSVSKRRKKGARGYAAVKHVKERKRFILIDRLGLLLKVVVTEVHVTERDGAEWLLNALGERFPQLKLVWLDGGFSRKDFRQRMLQPTRLQFELVKRPDATKALWCCIAAGLLSVLLRGSATRARAKLRGRVCHRIHLTLNPSPWDGEGLPDRVTPPRHVMERGLGGEVFLTLHVPWLSNYRRLSNDYEFSV